MSDTRLITLLFGLLIISMGLGRTAQLIIGTVLIILALVAFGPYHMPLFPLR